MYMTFVLGSRVQKSPIKHAIRLLLAEFFGFCFRFSFELCEDIGFSFHILKETGATVPVFNSHG